MDFSRLFFLAAVLLFAGPPARGEIDSAAGLDAAINKYFPSSISTGPSGGASLLDSSASSGSYDSPTSVTGPSDPGAVGATDPGRPYEAVSAPKPATGTTKAVTTGESSSSQTFLPQAPVIMPEREVAYAEVIGGNGQPRARILVDQATGMIRQADADGKTQFVAKATGSGFQRYKVTPDNKLVYDGYTIRTKGKGGLNTLQHFDKNGNPVSTVQAQAVTD